MHVILSNIRVIRGDNGQLSHIFNHLIAYFIIIQSSYSIVTRIGWLGASDMLLLILWPFLWPVHHLDLDLGPGLVQLVYLRRV